MSDKTANWNFNNRTSASNRQNITYNCLPCLATLLDSKCWQCHVCLLLQTNYLQTCALFLSTILVAWREHNGTWDRSGNVLIYQSEFDNSPQFQAVHNEISIIPHAFTHRIPISFLNVQSYCTSQLMPTEALKKETPYIYISLGAFICPNSL